MARRHLLWSSALIIAAVTVGFAQAPQKATATLKNAQGVDVGTATITPAANGSVQIAATFSKLPPGTHGIHIHTVGKCEAPDFATAGGHFNPASKQHGKDNPNGAHAGDLANFDVAADGTGKIEHGARRDARRRVALSCRRHGARDSRLGRRLQDRSVGQLGRADRLRRHPEVARRSQGALHRLSDGDGVRVARPRLGHARIDALQVLVAEGHPHGVELIRTGPAEALFQGGERRHRARENIERPRPIDLACRRCGSSSPCRASTRSQLPWRSCSSSS